MFQERTRDHSKEAEAFKEQLTNRSNEYVEEILSPHFGGVIQFVREGEALVEKEQLDELKQQESKYFDQNFYLTGPFRRFAFVQWRILLLQHL